MVSNRYRSPGSSRGSSRKRQRLQNQNCPKAEKDSDIESRSSVSSREGSTCVPVLAPSSITSSTRHRHANEYQQCDDDSRHSHSSHHRRRKHHRTTNLRNALPAPDEAGEKSAYPTTVAIREEYPVQTIPRTYQRDLSPDEEEVYDHRPRPLSRRSHGDRNPGRRRVPSESQRANAAEQGFCMAAFMVVVSLFICLGEAD